MLNNRNTERTPLNKKNTVYNSTAADNHITQKKKKLMLQVN